MLIAAPPPKVNLKFLDTIPQHKAWFHTPKEKKATAQPEANNEEQPPAERVEEAIQQINDSLAAVRAKIVSADRVAEYRWSSLAVYAQRQRPDWLVPSTVLRESGGLSDTPAGWRAYRVHLATIHAEDPESRGKRFAQLTRAWAIGSAAFRAKLRENYARSTRRADVSNSSERIVASSGTPEPKCGRISCGRSQRHSPSIWPCCHGKDRPLKN
jgi:hypothetical protein